MLGNYSDTLSGGDTEWAYFFRFDITKQHRNNEIGTILNNNTSIMSVYVVCYDQ